MRRSGFSVDCSFRKRKAVKQCVFWCSTDDQSCDV